MTTSTHFRLDLIPGTMSADKAYNYWSKLGLVYQVPNMAGCTKAVWNVKFPRHFYTVPRIE